jgi:hypothetical protein
MKNGDFSAFLALPNGAQYQIFNPFTRRPDPANPGHFIEDPFVGNIIPTGMINSVSKALLKFFPDPLSAGTPEFLNNNADSTLAEKTKKYNNYTFRVDHIVSDKQRIFVRGSLYTRNSFYNDYFHDAATGTSFSFYSKQGVIDDVYTFNSTTVLDVKYGYNRFIRFQDMAPAAQGFDLASLGFPASYVSAIDPTVARFPRIDFPSGTYQGTGQTNENRPDDSHSVAATLNKTIATHTFKTGVEFRAYRQNDIFASNTQTGQFVFDNTFTRNSDTSTGVTQVALSFAAFLLGIPSSGGVTKAADFAEQSKTWGFFVQDDWKVNSRLTLNLGLRYEFEDPLTERYNKSVTGFDLSFVQPFQSTVQSKYAALNDAALKALVPQLTTIGGLEFAGVNGQSDGLYQTPKHNIMPRFGLAFRLNDKTVFRGGYGIFYGFLGQRRGDVIQTGFSQVTNFVPTTNQLDANGHVIFSSTLSNPFPNGILSPTGSSLGPQTNVGNAISFFNQHPQTPYNQRWEVDIQRELPAGFVLEASYVGNRSTHVEISRDINAVPNQFLSTLPTRDATAISFLTGNVANPFFGLIPGVGASSTIQRINLLKPFPEFGSITTTTNDGYAWYHAAQLSLQKRFSKGLTFQASYTHSKFMQATEYLNPGDPLPYRTVSDQDYPNRFAMSYIYELPIGGGHRLLKSSNGIVSRLVSGWQIQGVYAYQTGAPLSWGNFIFFGDPSSITIPSDQQSIAQWFDTTGFVALRDNKGKVQTTNGLSSGPPIWVSFNDPCKNSFNATTCPGTPLANPTGFNRDSSFQLANNIRTFPLRFGNLRVEPTNNVDFSFMKYTRIKESMSVQFRVEMLNAFNHPWLSASSGGSGSSGVITGPTSATFGQIANISNQANYARRLQIGVKFIF